MDDASKCLPSRVVFQDASYELKPGDTLLEAFLRGGADVDFSCRRGSCQVCLLQTVSGDPGPDASAGLRADQREAGLFLACQARPQGELSVAKPDLNKLTVPIHLTERERLSPTVVRLVFEPESALPWKAGQFIVLTHPSGEQRSYSIASVDELDFVLELHVREVRGGLVSNWLCSELEIGEVLLMRGPAGACIYNPEHTDRDLLLIAGGTGLAPLIGVARDALHQGHKGHITLLHGVAAQADLYLHKRLRDLETAHSNLTYEAWVTEDCPESVEGVEQGGVVDAAFRVDRSECVLYLAGPPGMVHAARYRAVLSGVARTDVFADPFDDARPTMPDDAGTLSRVPPDPELWEALEGGPGLNTILRDFYDFAYEDARLAPFFHNITKQRAIEKQYEFLSSVFMGTKHYFGARPFNAHHWMIISDALFDYRELCFEASVRRYGMAEHLIRRWLAFHELFRAVIVKSEQRGTVIDGVERNEQGYRKEVLSIDSLCDGCYTEIAAGTPARHHLLTGKLYCDSCGPQSAAQNIHR